jgi:hypothetical protein
MVDTCCGNYDHCSLGYNKDDEIKRLNEKIEFLARTNMLYSDWEHRETQVTSQLIRKGIEEGKINAELRAEIEHLKQRTWVGLKPNEIKSCWLGYPSKNGYPPERIQYFYNAVESALRDKNT